MLKVEATKIDITDSNDDLRARVELVDDGVVMVNLPHPVGWNDWLDLTDAVRQAMLMMGVRGE
jgi:hypothetical protein